MPQVRFKFAIRLSSNSEARSTDISHHGNDDACISDVISIVILLQSVITVVETSSLARTYPQTQLGYLSTKNILLI